MKADEIVTAVKLQNSTVVFGVQLCLTDNLTQKMCGKWDRSGPWRLFEQVIPVLWQAWLLRRKRAFSIECF